MAQNRKKERFSGLVLRLFHTELESVYEEFNRAQDNDVRLKIMYSFMEAPFSGNILMVNKPLWGN